ncbi:MAG: alpha/beta hydrolase [Ilumatobacteraceae bacterium]
MRYIAVAALLTAGCSGATTVATVVTTTPTASSTTSTTTSIANCRDAGLATTVAYTTIAGVDENLTSLDIYQPPTVECDAPVVMWVHGGGYSIGDKSNQIANKARLFNDAGWILVSVNYRLTTPGLSNSAQYPDHYNDVADAVAWVHDNIADYGGDPTRIALLGHSAGADIVSNVVTNPDYLHDVGLELSAISCAGPLDTEGFDKAQAGSNDPDGQLAQWKNALGNNPDYIAQTSATLLVEPGIGIPPMIGVTRGTPQRQQIEMAFLAALTAAGIDAVTIDARSLTHSEVSTRIGAANDQVMTPPLMQFLTNCLN